MEWVGQFRRQRHAIGWTLSETCEIASRLLTPPRCAPDDRGAIQLVGEVRSAFADLHPGLSSIRRVLSGRQRSQDRICSRFSKFYGVIKATDNRLSTLGLLQTGALDVADWAESGPLFSLISVPR